MYKAGIIGGGGYTAGELIRILLYHPSVEIDYVLSNSQAGKKVYETHTDLIGETELVFTNAFRSDVDVLFLCMGHGASKTFLDKHTVPPSTLVVDLSRDYRLTNDFVYGLPELHRKAIASSKRIANPGCFATTIQLGLLPLAAAGLIQAPVHVNALTGSTGAGQSPRTTTHFSWRNNNISIYKAFRHQHMDEILQSVRFLQPGMVSPIHFLPVRGDFTRGIFASMYTDCDLSQDQLVQLYADYYQSAPFTILSATNPNLKQVVNTNKCIVFVEKHDDKALIISMTDNLLKGASGQAVQNMNLALGLEETDGLGLKASYF